LFFDGGRAQDGEALQPAITCKDWDGKRGAFQAGD
jgi:hypothetical protein